MKYVAGWIFGCLTLCLSGAQAAPLDQTLHPVPRPGFATLATSGPALIGIRPVIRPPSSQERLAAQRVPGDPIYAPSGSIRPMLRTPDFVERIMSKKRELRKGQVCGNIDIQGEKVGRVPGRIKACGIEDAVSIRSVSGVRLSQASLMDCTTAQALNTWVDKGVKPAFKKRGPVVEMKVAAHYACRTRNHKPGAKISEHGKGRAIDISAFTMSDGEVITVLKGWRHGNTRDMLCKVHRAACGPFGTVLGPEADRAHQDHFHFDTARYRGGAYCR